MKKAFVFGKFYPFHQGHQAMIDFALQHCDVLSVLVCASLDEKINGKTRKQWIEETYFGNPKIRVDVFEYSENDFPNTSESSQEVSKIWSSVFKRLYPDYQFIITSEPYGEFVAEYLGIQHIAFDFERNKILISASKIRENIFENWAFLPLSVKKYFQLKVTILGTESTGKSTLAKKLSEHFGCNLVEEAGREIIESSQQFAFEDLQKVALAHAKQIENVDIENHFLSILDTDIHITESYAEFVFSQSLEVDEKIQKINQADLYLYLDKTTTYVQDGTRLEKEQRDALDISHRKILEKHAIPITEIKGSYEDRFQQAIEAVPQLINLKSKI